MAIITNTYQTTSAVGNREELSDIVSRITPEDTPIYTLIGSGKLASKHPEWEFDALRAPAANAQLEGDTYTFNATVAPTRVGNYTQIFRESWSISNTQDAVDNAGNVEKRKEQKLKKAVQVKKDVEFAIVSNTASVSGATRLTGSLPSWLTTNVSRNGAGANGGFSSGTGLTVAETLGTQRAFTKALLDTTMQSVYVSGGNATHCVVSPYVKSVFVTFMSDTNVATFRYMTTSTSKNTIVGTADMYEGPFGKVTVLPNRVMAASAAVARRAYLIDPDMASFDWLRPISEDPGIAKIADAEQGVIIGEGTLRIKNEAGLGVVADLFGLTAAS
jgi:hypothetical protein